MPIWDIVLDALIKIATSVAAKLIADRLTRSKTDSRRKRKRGRARKAGNDAR